MPSFFITIMHKKLFIMFDESKIVDDFPNLSDCAKMENIVGHAVDWSSSSALLDMSRIFDIPIYAVTYNLKKNTQFEIFRDDLIDYALNIYQGEQAIS